MPTVLVMGDEEKQKLEDLKAYAEEHPLTMDDLLDIMHGAPAPGDRPEYTCLIPFDYKVVFTIEPNARQVPIRHLSISVKAKGRLPLPEACQMIMVHLGFQNRIDSGRCKVEYERDIAISIAELV